MRRMIPQKNIEKLDIVTNYLPDAEIPEIYLTQGLYNIGQSYTTGSLDEKSGVFYAGIIDSATDWVVGADYQDSVPDYLAGIASFCNEDSSNPQVHIILNGNTIVKFNEVGVIISNLPTSDPGIKGALWNDNGTVKISAGQ